VLEAAGRAINEGIDRFNARHVVDFGSSTDTDTALVDGTNSYTLDADFFAVRDVQLVDTDSDVQFRLTYVPWEEFNKRHPKQSQTGRPDIWTARNTFDDKQSLLYPVPDSGAAADYTIRVTTYTRIDRPASDSDIINAPRELGPALCWYGGWKLLAIKKGAGHVDTQLARREWEQWFRDFTASVRRQPAGGQGWFMEWDGTGEPPDDGVYGKLG